jgi:uroporphyrinogen decarboxylase
VPDLGGEGSDRLAERMTSLERTLAALRREEPDRVPVFEFMIDPKVIEGILPGGDYLDLVEILDIDCVVTPTPSRMYHLERIGERNGSPLLRTEWGELRMANVEMVTIPVGHPLQTRADWDKVEIPDPDKPERLDSLRALVERFKGRRAIGCHLHDSFTYPSYLFGMSDLLANLLLEPDWVKEVIRACNEHCVRMVALAAEAGADFILLGDDVGGKSGPLMSPAHYEEFFLPGLAAVTQKAHEKGACVIKHTDGNVYRLLELFAEAGIDAFHPSDPSAGMDIVEVKRAYGGHFAVCGGIDTGDPLSHWPVSDLVAEVRKRIRELAPGGGWMIASSNTVHSSVRPENYHAMVVATRTYGHYGHLDQPISARLESSIGKIPIQADCLDA